MGSQASPVDGVNAAEPPDEGADAPGKGPAGPALGWREQPDAVARVAALLLLVATVAAYVNSLGVPFVFDDRIDIIENASLRRLWPPWAPFLADTPADGFLRGRPLVNFTLALNYAMGQLDTLYYHLTNLAIHAIAGLLLFGLVRKTLLLPRLADRYAAVATPLAFTVAAFWALHPLQTQAVTYVIQRYESLMGMFYLLSLYSVLQSERSAQSRRWEAATVLACLASILCKEVAVSIPLMVLLYDRAFLSGSFREAWRRRRGMYVGLAGCWIALAALLLLSGGRGDWAGYEIPVPWFDYAKSQFGVILHYLQLCFWPSPQVFDYRWPVADGLDQILPGLVVVGGLFAAAAWALVRRPMWGTIGAFFFLVLAPTSSIMPIADLAFEHRMYLPLASVILATVLAAYELSAPWFSRSQTAARTQALVLGVLVLIVAAALGITTHVRNTVYESEWLLWSDVVEKAPQNARAFVNLGSVLYKEGRTEEAIPLFRRAMDLDPFMAGSHLGLGGCLERQGKTDQAIAEYREEIRIHPRNADAYSNLAALLARGGQTAEALQLCTRALEIRPGLAAAHNNLANILTAVGKLDEAVAHYQRALELTPQSAELYNNLGDVLRRAGKLDGAIAYYRAAVELNPVFAEAYANLAMALSLQSKADEAIACYQKAIQIRPDYLEAYNNLAVFLARQGRVDDAIGLWYRMLEIKPSLPEVHWMLGMALDAQQKTKEAVAHWREAVRLKPDFVPALVRLAWTLATSPQAGLRNGAEAVKLAEKAEQVAGKPAPELLDTLAAAQAEAGRFPEAVKTAEKAVRLASEQGNTALAAALRERLALYQKKTAFRDAPVAGSKPVGGAVSSTIGAPKAQEATAPSAGSAVPRSVPARGSAPN